MGKTRTFQIVYLGPTNLCQRPTIDLTRNIISNERKQSALSKVRSFNHSKVQTAFFCIQFITNGQIKVVSFT